jgi:hypothetical protein
MRLLYAKGAGQCPGLRKPPRFDVPSQTACACVLRFLVAFPVWGEGVAAEPATIEDNEDHVAALTDMNH